MEPTSRRLSTPTRLHSESQSATPPLSFHRKQGVDPLIAGRLEMRRPSELSASSFQRRARADTPQLPPVVPKNLLRDVKSESSPVKRSKFMEFFSKISLDKPTLSRKNLYVSLTICLAVILIVSVSDVVIGLTNPDGINVFILAAFLPVVIAWPYLAYLTYSSWKNVTGLTLRFQTITSILAFLMVSFGMFCDRVLCWKNCSGKHDWFEWDIDHWGTWKFPPCSSIFNAYYSSVVVASMLIGIIRVVGSLRLFEQQNQNEKEDEEIEISADIVLDREFTNRMRSRAFDQMVLLYVFVVLIIAAGYLVSWIPEFGPAWIFVHLYVSVIALEAQRRSNDAISRRSLFVTALPAAVVATTTCGASKLISIFFFFMTILTQMQLVGVLQKTTQTKMLKMTRVYTMLYALVVYPLSVSLNQITFRYLPAFSICRPTPSYTSKFLQSSMMSELFVVMVILFVGLAFSYLQVVVVESLRSRLKAIKLLAMKTAELSEEVFRLKNVHDESPTLEVPLKIATDSLRNLIHQVKNSNLQRALSNILRNLSRQNVYEVEMTGMNESIKEYLPAELANRFEERIHDSENIASASMGVGMGMTDGGSAVRSIRQSYSSNGSPVTVGGAGSVGSGIGNMIHARRRGNSEMSMSSSKSDGSAMGDKSVDADGDMDMECIMPYATNLNVNRDLKIPDEFDINDWNVDVFGLEDALKSSMLYVVTAHVMKKHNLFALPHLDKLRFKNFIDVISGRYHDNAYHNLTHATDVTLVMSHFLEHGLSEKLTSIERLAAIVASVIHDVDHPGNNNGLEIARESELALMYSDTSVLENHHLHVAFKLLQVNSLNFMHRMKRQPRRHFRKLVIRMVLSTDMADHFNFVGKFSSALAGQTEWRNVDDKSLLLAIAMKCADISNPLKKQKLAVKWSARVMCEFWRQGDIQKSSGFEVSAFFDRNKLDVGKCQVGFVDYVVSPLFKSWTCIFPDYKCHMETMASNRMFWKSKSEEEAANLVCQECPDYCAMERDSLQDVLWEESDAMLQGFYAI